MIRFLVAAYILALTTGIAFGADWLESKRAPLDTRADTDPNSDFWRGVQPVFAERDTSGNLVPGHRPKSGRDGLTGTSSFFSFAPTSSSI